MAAESSHSPGMHCMGQDLHACVHLCSHVARGPLNFGSSRTGLKRPPAWGKIRACHACILPPVCIDVAAPHSGIPWLYISLLLYNLRSLTCIGDIAELLMTTSGRSAHPTRPDNKSSTCRSDDILQAGRAYLRSALASRRCGNLKARQDRRCSRFP